MNSQQAVMEKQQESEKSHGTHNLQDNNDYNSNEKLELKWESEDSEAWAVKNTPFQIMKKEESWWVIMGKYRLTTELNSKEEAIEDAQRTDWDRLMQIVQIMIEENKEIKHEL